MKILHLGPQKIFPEEECHFVSTNITQGSLPNSEPTSVKSLLKNIIHILRDNEEYDFAVIRCLGPMSFGPEKISKFKTIGKKLFRKLFVKVAVHCKKKEIPVVIIDHTDYLTIDPDDRIMLELCDLYFKRELASNRLNSCERILQGECIGQIGNIPFFQKAVKKLRPISLGYGGNFKEPREERDYDYFYIGEAKLIEERERMAIALKKLKDKGYKVYLPTEDLTADQFHEALRNSWFCPSPMGCGWDCYRHYEILAAGSIPIVTHPSIEAYETVGDHNQTGLTLNHLKPLLPQLESYADLSLEERKNTISNGKKLLLEHHINEALGHYIKREISQIRPS